MSEKGDLEKGETRKSSSKTAAVIFAMLGVLHLVLMMIATLRNEANYAFWGLGLIAVIMFAEFVLAFLYGAKKIKKWWIGGVLAIVMLVATFFIPACDYTRYSGCTESLGEQDVNFDCLTSGGETANIYGF